MEKSNHLLKELERVVSALRARLNEHDDNRKDVQEMLHTICEEMRKEIKELEALEKAPADENIPLELKDEIVYDDFDKLDLRVGTIISAEKHPDADKLLVFQVKMGTEKRQIISGVAKYFKPEDCVGKKVVVVANLKPRKLRGLESKGMILFADNEVDGKSTLEFVSTDAEDGNSVE